MEALWHAFDEINPGYYRRTKMHFTHLRRLILLARLDPDNEMVSNTRLRALVSLVAKNTGHVGLDLIHLQFLFADDACLAPVVAGRARCCFRNSWTAQSQPTASPSTTSCISSRPSMSLSLQTHAPKFRSKVVVSSEPTLCRV
jgi:hypothetical protein